LSKIKSEDGDVQKIDEEIQNFVSSKQVVNKFQKPIVKLQKSKRESKRETNRESRD
jgi:hypothetical protein